MELIIYFPKVFNACWEKSNHVVVCDTYTFLSATQAATSEYFDTKRMYAKCKDNINVKTTKNNNYAQLI